MKQTFCSQCGSQRVRRSRRRSVVERLAGLAGRVTRCHDCGLRTLVIAGWATRVDVLHRAASRTSFTIALVLTSFLVLGAILWFARLNFAEAGSMILIPHR